jgi:hypothetical protein
MLAAAVAVAVPLVVKLLLIVVRPAGKVLVPEPERIKLWYVAAVTDCAVPE